MTFGWQGFSLEHPEDWAPINITGERKEGYVRIASPGRISFQVRWKISKQDVDLSSVLNSYLARLSQDAKSKKLKFQSEVDTQDEKLVYRYSSVNHGRGAILQSKSCGRVFFLEAISTKNDSLLPAFRKLLDGFSEAQDFERWAILGIDLMLPKGLEVEKKVLQAGRTQLTLSCRSARIEAQRWGFAEQLVAKHGLETWTRSVLNLQAAQLSQSYSGIALEQAGNLLKPSVYGLARVQEDRNQIATVRVSTRDQGWKPTWEWFA